MSPNRANLCGRGTSSHRRSNTLGEFQSGVPRPTGNIATPMVARSRFPRGDMRRNALRPYAFSVARRWLLLTATLAIGGAAALWELSPWRDDDRVRTALFALAIAGIVVLAIEWAVRLVRSRQGEYRTIAASDIIRGSYIDHIVSLGRAVMGDGHADADTLRRRLERCREGISVLVRREQQSFVREAVVGYLVCWTISESAAESFLSGEYRSGLDLQETDLVTDRCAAAYVTMIFGVDYAARLRMLGVAASRLDSVFSDHTGPQMLLARPATKEGERLMRKLGMKPLGLPGSLVWSVDRETLRRTLAANAI